jgi:hypothetical protein
MLQNFGSVERLVCYMRLKMREVVSNAGQRLPAE